LLSTRGDELAHADWPHPSLDRCDDSVASGWMQEAIDIVRGRRREDGRWVLEHTYRGKTYFELERVGRPSRWTTLRALRVLRWWEGGR
jgi:hypothetical protein